LPFLSKSNQSRNKRNKFLNVYFPLNSFSINDVQDKNEFFWRYQRYELIREYFEKPIFAFPPFSLLVYVWLLIKIITCQGFTFRIFSKLLSDVSTYCFHFILYLERFKTPQLNILWTDFENAATYAYARQLVEDTQRSPNKFMCSG